MWDLVRDMEKVCESLLVKCSRISMENASVFHNCIISNYTNSVKYFYPIWDNLANPVIYYNPEGWRILGDYIKNERIILFFEPRDSKEIFVFENGCDVVLVLSEMHGFVLYISNESLDYLICFNDHDVLFACGMAASWLEAVSKKL